ncbi:MAG: MarC family protein, partial [Nitrosopumilaceae archaeon]
MAFENLFLIPETFSVDLIRTIIILFVVIDPIGIIPITMGLTKNLDKKKKKHKDNHNSSERLSSI